LIRRLYPSAEALSEDTALENEYLVADERHVRANFVISLDGMVEIDGRSSPLGGSADRAAFMTMRAVTDVILVGAGTVRQENYGPVRLDTGSQDRRIHRGQPALPTLAIVSNRADLDPTAKVFSGDVKPLLLTSLAGAARHRDLAAVAEMVTCGDESVDLTAALDTLLARRLGRVLCEGGPTLLHSLIEADLMDELCCTTSPSLAGPGHRSLVGDQQLTSPVALHLTSVLEGDGMVLARYATRSSR
jgi:riboflavin biosynthesis pyrimidine reductase